MESFYRVLGVEESASTDEIKDAYRRRLLASHPDKTGTAIEGDEIARITAAYRTLVDTAKRHIYDQDRKTELSRLGIANGGGLEVYSLDEFDMDPHKDLWTKSCPRCTSPHGFELSETDLDKGTSTGPGMYELIVQCSSCSLWLIVKYEEAQD
ncbi:hypothetical protein OGAPHI_005346 [Ogataea philodendri]|uniref:Diphthamide biosynthesis protein 4 n=1 Tax=Ogataea philodendri TaxID=1378263 RepID=A0A9P8P1P1_9ASCO|nr:uncharacterized protein OGAPHI_005346 [Ogataea philodendri]KAH3663356.1 hypothetical protein OGAPHI_005346 [Ogataea philodendri]